MKYYHYIIWLVLFFMLFGCGQTDRNTGGGYTSSPQRPIIDANAPTETAKLIFIHHSTGSDWLESGYGNLGTALNNNNYYVSETDYGWYVPPSPPAASNIGDHTDTVDWPSWFNDDVMPYVCSEDAKHSYANTLACPTGNNQIIMFKSCFPNSDVGDSIADEQAIYTSLLPYCAANTANMFVLIVPPPMQSISYPAQTRALANWLVDTTNGWLKNYTEHNVFVFDYYNVLTDPNNHHRIYNNTVQHYITGSPANPAHPDELYYPSSDDHPNASGQQKATAEFVPLLNYYYRQWKAAY